MTTLPTTADKAQAAADRERNWQEANAYFNALLDEAAENAVLRQVGFNPDYPSGRKPHQPTPGIYNSEQHARNLGEM